MNDMHFERRGSRSINWTAAEKKLLYRTPVLTLNAQSALSPEGTEKDFITVDARSWVITVPLLKKEQAGKAAGIKEPCFLLVEQWRAGAQELSTEFPGGVINDGEKPEKAAVRELLEETGFKALKCTPLGAMNPNPALFCNKVYFFAAENLTDTRHTHPDEDEFLKPLIVPVAEVLKKMGQPPYIHALTAAALCLYNNRLSDQFLGLC